MGSLFGKELAYFPVVVVVVVVVVYAMFCTSQMKGSRVSSS